MKKAIISFLIPMAVVSMLVTVFLQTSTSNYDMNKSNDALTFIAPHLQKQEQTTTATTNDGDDNTLPRRNLSEVDTSTLTSNINDNPAVDTSAEIPIIKPFVSGNRGITQQQKKKKEEEQSNNSDNRPSGVIYQYIPPQPINITARSLLHKQFRQFDSNLDGLEDYSSALCGIVKDAEQYLDEWVDYHFGLGFHTIYLIDNSKDHELQNWQNKRRNAGYSVRVMPKPGTHRQMYGYHMCAAEHRKDHKFMAFFDVDEYLVLKKHNSVNEMLEQHLPKGSLAISWYIFGTGNKDLYAPIPVTKRFLYRDGVDEGDRHPQSHNVKAILKSSDYGGYPQSPHSMKTKGSTWIDTNGLSDNFDKIGASNSNRPLDVAVIHHYKYLSSKEFYWKSCIRKTVDDKFKDCENLKLKPPFKGSIYDDSAWVALKQNVPKYAMFDNFEDFM